MKWGIWGKALGTGAILELIETSLEVGIHTFDLADIYGDHTTEADVGRALARVPHLRQQMVLVTKCGIRFPNPNRPEVRVKHYDVSKAHIIRSAEQSLRHLHTDWLDVLLIHRPSPLLDPEEVAAAFDELHRAGKVRYFGVSNFTPSQYELLARHVPLVTNQVEASVLHRAPFLDGTFDQAMMRGFRPMVWGPLGGGTLFERGNPVAVAVRDAATELMAKYDCTFDQLLLAWLLRHPAGLVPVLGTARAERIRQSVRALDIELNEEEWFMLWQAAGGEVP